MESFGDRLSTLRKSKGLKKSDLAQQIGVANSTIGRIEKGTLSPTVDIILRICDFLEVSPDWLFYGEGEKYIEKDLVPGFVPKSGEVVLMAKGYGGKSEIVTLSEKDYELAKSLFERFRSDDAPEKRN